MIGDMIAGAKAAKAAMDADSALLVELVIEERGVMIRAAKGGARAAFLILYRQLGDGINTLPDGVRLVVSRVRS